MGHEGFILAAWVHVLLLLAESAEPSATERRFRVLRFHVPWQDYTFTALQLLHLVVIGASAETPKHFEIFIAMEKLLKTRECQPTFFENRPLFSGLEISQIPRAMSRIGTAGMKCRAIETEDIQHFTELWILELTDDCQSVYPPVELW